MDKILQTNKSALIKKYFWFVNFKKKFSENLFKFLFPSQLNNKNLSDSIFKQSLFIILLTASSFYSFAQSKINKSSTQYSNGNSNEVKTVSESSIDANITSGISGKKHFIIHFHEMALDTMAYYKAAYYFPRFEQYRFYDKRRTINFVNGKASIELFSALELYEHYGKRINQQVIKDGAFFPEIEFEFSNEMLKEQIIK